MSYMQLIIQCDKNRQGVVFARKGETVQDPGPCRHPAAGQDDLLAMIERRRRRLLIGWEKVRRISSDYGGESHTTRRLQAVIMNVLSYILAVPVVSTSEREYFWISGLKKRKISALEPKYSRPPHITKKRNL